jgi:hypothetical protein
MRKLHVVVAALVLGVPSAALADQYWITYEGNDYPENEGWDRHAYGGGAERYLQDGVLILDGRASPDISDFYRWNLPSDPGPGEYFVAQWRMRVDEVTGFAEPDVTVGSYGHGSVILSYSTTGSIASSRGCISTSHQACSMSTRSFPVPCWTTASTWTGRWRIRGSSWGR